MLKLEDIGFLEVTEKRAANIAPGSLSYCEWIITPRCNFKCPYCKPLKGRIAEEISLSSIKEIISVLSEMNLKYIHLTGGEPTVRKDLPEIICAIKSKGIRVGLSSNGSAKTEYYTGLIDLGVELMSFSLDVHKNDLNKKFTSVDNIFDRVVNNIRETSKQIYVNVGVVFNDDNIEYYKDIVGFISGLGVSDIKLATDTSYNKIKNFDIPKSILDRHKILKYRVDNFNTGKNMRGLARTTVSKCHLVKDDITLVGKYFFPCAVYAREGGEPLGVFDSNNEAVRLKWFEFHNSLKDDICYKYCMDFKCRFNEKMEILCQ